MAYLWPNRPLTKADTIDCLKAASACDPALTTAQVRAHFGNWNVSASSHYYILWEGLRALSIQRTADRLMKLTEIKITFPPERILLYDGVINNNFAVFPFERSELVGGMTAFANTLTDDVVRLGNQPRYLWGSSNFRTGYCVSCGKSANAGWILHPDEKIEVGTLLPSQGWMRLYNLPGAHPVREALLHRIMTTGPGPGSTATWMANAFQVAMICKGCTLSCEECGARAGFEISDANLPPIIREKRCVGCIGLTLTAVLAPKPSRSELRIFRKNLTIS